MASSRHNIRRSQRTSPLENSSTKTISLNRDADLHNNKEDLSEEWTEPPVRTPVPSFEDYKGLERHGVLEHMAPLGTFPNSKVKARLKQHEAPRRATHPKNGERRVPKEDVCTPEPAPPAVARRSEPCKTDEKTPKVPSLRSKNEDPEYIPTLKSNAKAVQAKPVSTSPVPPSPASCRTAQGRMDLKNIVDTAVARANQLNDRVLGHSVMDLYMESLHNPTVADLLDAVLMQRPLPEQTKEFQSRIRVLRRKNKNRQQDGLLENTALKSSTAKSPRSSVTRHMDDSKNPSSPHLPNGHAPNTIRRSSERISDTMEVKGSPSKDERPSKRIKRSKSTSSDSSLLSSVDSAIDDEEPPPTIKASTNLPSNHTSDQRAHQSKVQPSNGPRLGTFPLRPTDPMARRPPLLLHTHSNPPPDDTTAKKREEFRLLYNQVLGTPQESAVRGSPSPMRTIQSTPPVAALHERDQKGKLRNGTIPRRGRDEHEALDSPGSSKFGEHLAPPGASRAATPNQLGRPSKVLKKAARIKMS